MNKRMTNSLRISSAVTAILCIATALSAVPARATVDTKSSDDLLTTSEITNSIEVAGNLVQPALTSVATNLQTYVSSTDDVTIEIPRSLENGVALSTPNVELTIFLPNADSASLGTKNNEGQVIFASAEASANTVIPIEGGVQMLTTISNKTAPERFTYSVEKEDSDYFQIQEDGSAVLIGTSGTVKLVIPAPWAQDSVGRSIPTSFETDGDSLVQVISHKSLDNVAYPVTADPYWIVVKCVAGVAVWLASNIILSPPAQGWSWGFVGRGVVACLRGR